MLFISDVGTAQSCMNFQYLCIHTFIDALWWFLVVFTQHLQLYDQNEQNINYFVSVLFS